MEIPERIRKVQPNQLVVFEKPVCVFNRRYNALFQGDDFGITFLDAEENEFFIQELGFFGDPKIPTVHGFERKLLMFALKLEEYGITPDILKDRFEFGKRINDLLRKSYEKGIETATTNALAGIKSFSCMEEKNE